ncbi:MAG: nucleotide exchange factor GrpE [Hyphomicrobiales bacterium]
MSARQRPGNNGNDHFDDPETVDTPVDAGVPEEGALDPEKLALQAENAELKDRLLRSMAEAENVRRRGEREKAEATLYAATNFARDLLSVADNLGRALEALPAEARDKADEAVKTLLAGVDLTHRELKQVFERYNIRLVKAKGEKFDPNVHQAMFEVPDASVPAGTVVQVVQDGYTIGDRVLRPALVGVAKGGPKPVQTEA